ncbi:hypothetical protein [Actinocorallia longicatena]|uniref:Uncharacterized protein n=1 Tax=Actinocorallia longicatena TaxID=111803 RepID=A0ABP6QP40_9ACTN
MIYFTETGWVAIFSGGGAAGTDTEIGRTRDVEGWDPESGAALVVDPQAGRVRPATDWEDFSHLEETHRAVTALPGGGWRARWDDEGGAPLIQPVLAWVVSSRGRVVPTTINTYGTEDESELGEPDHLLAPGEELRPVPRPPR